MRNDQFLLLYRRRTDGSSVARITLSGLSIAEDAAGDTVIGTLSVANGSGSYTFSITSDPDSKFQIINDDELALGTEATLDYETATSHQLTIEADNGVDDPISRTFTISVTNVLEVTLAALSLDAAEITENSAEDTAVGAVQDKSSGSTLTLIDDAGGRFKLSGTNIVAGATPSDYESATSYNITLRETHPDASNSPRDTVIEVTILDDPDDTDTVPAAFGSGDWSIAPGDEEADVTISDLPDDGGDTITDVEYRLDGGSWVSSGGTSSFTISGLTNDQEYDVELRAVNSVGAGEASDTKQVTPEDAGGETFEEAVIILLGAKLRAFWLYDEPSHLWQDTSATTPVASDTDPVGRVDDLSGNGKHLLQATGGNRPAFRTLPNRVVFDGVNDYLSIATPAFPIDEIELFQVVEQHAVGSDFQGFYSFAPSSGSDWNSTNGLAIETGNSSHRISITGNDLIINQAGTGTFSVTLYEFQKTATTSALYMNTSLIGTDDSFTTFTSPHGGNFADGARHAPNIQLFAPIARRATIITAGLTSGERSDLRNLINARYSLW